tara:strand:+ start:47029 stop:47730 length:702 start_codon:yes stop_codon:yes gene_type:complete
MFTRFFVVLFCLTGIETLCLGENPVPVPRHQTKDDAAILAKVKTIQFGPFELKAKDLKLRVTIHDQNRISLTGNAQLTCGDTRLSADHIEFFYSDQHDLRMLLKGDIEIENERDQLRIFANEAQFDYRQKLLMLKSRERGHVALSRTKGQITTLVEASAIHIKYKNLHTMQIRPFENVSIVERPARQTDLIKLETAQQSEFDFFDGISIEDVQIFSEKDHIDSRKVPVEVKKP